MLHRPEQEREHEKIVLPYPPRVEHVISPEQLERMRGFIAQPKYNEWRSLVVMTPEKEVQFFNRKKEPLRRFRPQTRILSRLIEAFSSESGSVVLDGGVMPETLILWDVLVLNKPLIGTTYEERYRLLKKRLNPLRTLYQPRTRIPYALEVMRGLWIPPVFSGELSAIYEVLSENEKIEGLVLKNPKGKLKRGLRAENNTDWQMKVRKPSELYAF